MTNRSSKKKKMSFDSDVEFLNDNVRARVSPTSNTPREISNYLINNNIEPTLETVIECIIKLQAAPANKNFCNAAIVRIRELLLLSIGTGERNDYENLVSQVLHNLTPPSASPQISVSPPAFSVSDAMLEGFLFYPQTMSQEFQEYNSNVTLDVGIPPNY
ncbi:14867_t:CDS:1 [Racocetra persica]|uniref:14867_t:CDS:1 n=1 Tax=Racocetra persica TaxID=160502 RepID=A0ACA9LUA1_9GLOM|nr:14867_t:CDS:1 [Racocetra persica]